VELLVTALAQAGRAGHALAALASYRDRLREELGLDPSPRLRRLEEQVLRGTLAPVAPVRSGHDRRVRAARPTSFVGRERELGQVREAIAAAPLVTLVGPGGVGKTRLAQEVAAIQDPMWWVDLAPLRDPGAVPYTVADAVGIDVLSGTLLPDALRQRARRAHGLLVLDNCEHLAAVAELADELLATASGLWLLATSRERLAIGGELVLDVAPLEAPPPGAPEGGPAVRCSSTGRKRPIPRWRPARPLLRRAADICRALDGLPLAIELAAARIGTLTFDDLADRLDTRFELLRTGRRDGDSRHQALQAVVDWSFELLGADEQRLFLRLSVFAAAFDIAAAETVAADDDLPSGRIADLVARLAEQSMLTRPGASGIGRYRMLETLRAYAASRLPDVEAERLRRRHASFVVDLTERLAAAAPGMPTGACAAISSPGGPGSRGGPAGGAGGRRHGRCDLAAVLDAYRGVAALAAPGDPAGLAIATANQALTLAYAGDDQAALASANPTALAMARFAQGEALADVDPARASAALEEALRRPGRSATGSSPAPP
jgi:predicted ATPase